MKSLSLAVLLFLSPQAFASYDMALSELLAQSEEIKVFRSSLLPNMGENAALNKVLAYLLVENDSLTQINTSNRCAVMARSKGVLDCSFTVERKERGRSFLYVLNYFVDASGELLKLVSPKAELSRISN
jgi:hypothetical protein